MNDIKNNIEDLYDIEAIDKNIDFRRVQKFKSIFRQ